MDARALNRNPFIQAFSEYIRSGNPQAKSEISGSGDVQIRASNAVNMTIGTPSAGGYLDPTGLGDFIVAKRSEMSLPERLGCTLIPGRGSTVNAPIDDEADGEFVQVNEEDDTDQDAPALGQASLTLKSYKKHIVLTQELLEDSDANLVGFLIDWIARCQAKTYNELLLAEVAASGTLFKTAASDSAIVAGELEATVFNDDVEYYLDDSPSIAWVMRPKTYGAIKSITGDPRVYGDFAGGEHRVLEYPVYFSNKAAVIGASAKVAYFGNWRLVGYREAPDITILRDVYSKAKSGKVVIHVLFRTVFKILQPAAVGYLAMHT